MSESKKEENDVIVPAIIYKTKELQNDFSWLEEVRVKKSNQQLFMADKAGKLLNSEKTIKESDFVRDWLWQFAVGLVGEHCYFDVSEWFEFTNNGKLSVAVVDDNNPKNVLFIIKPFTETGLTQEELRNMRLVGTKLSRMGLTPDLQERSRIFKENITFLSQSLNSKRKEFEDHIPPEFFAKHKIYPWVCKHVIFIRDTFHYDPNSKALGLIESILIKYHLKQRITKSEYEFIMKATANTIELKLDYKVVESENKSSESINPNEC